MEYYLAMRYISATLLYTQKKVMLREKKNIKKNIYCVIPPLFS